MKMASEIKETVCFENIGFVDHVYKSVQSKDEAPRLRFSGSDSKPEGDGNNIKRCDSACVSLLTDNLSLDKRFIVLNDVSTNQKIELTNHSVDIITAAVDVINFSTKYKLNLNLRQFSSDSLPVSTSTLTTKDADASTKTRRPRFRSDGETWLTPRSMARHKVSSKSFDTLPVSSGKPSNSFYNNSYFESSPAVSVGLPTRRYVSRFRATETFSGQAAATDYDSNHQILNGADFCSSSPLLTTSSLTWWNSHIAANVKNRVEEEREVFSYDSDVTEAGSAAGVGLESSSDEEEIKKYLSNEKNIEMVKFLEMFTTNIFDTRTIISSEDKAIFGETCRSDQGRQSFVNFLKQQIVQIRNVDEDVFLRLVQFFAVVLFECDEAEDYGPAQALLGLSLVISHTTWEPCKRETQDVLLFSYLKSQPIWQSLRFWNATYFDAVQQNKSIEDAAHNCVGYEYGWGHEVEYRSRMEAKHLGMFVSNMHTLGLDRNLCLQFLRRQAASENLSPEEIDLIRDNVTSRNNLQLSPT